MKRRLLAFILALCYIFTQTGIVTFAAEIGNETEDEYVEVTTGTCGDNGGFTWYFDDDTGALVITGEDTWTKDLEESIYDYVGTSSNNIIFKDCVFSGSLKAMLGTDAVNWTLQSVKFINCDTSNVTDMSFMFFNCNILKEVDFGGLDTSNVTNMSYMFTCCFELSNIDISGFNTSKVTDMSCMFDECKSLSSLDVSKFDTTNTINMQYMFADCSSLTSLDVSKFDTSNVTNMGGMFYGCEGLQILDVSKFDTSNVTNMQDMFVDCVNIASLDVSDFDTSKVTDMSSMFGNCNSLTSLDVSKFDTSNVTNMGGMFGGCINIASLDVSKFDTSNVTNMGGMFGGCINIASLDVSKFDTSNVTKMGWMFSDCSNLEKIDLTGFDTSNVIDMLRMFENCAKLSILDLSNFDTSRVKDIYYMLYGCSNLQTIYTPKEINKSIDLPEIFYDLDMNQVSSIGSAYENMVLTKNINNTNDENADNSIIIDVSDSIDANKVSRIRVTDSYGEILSDVTLAYDDNIQNIEGKAELYIDKEAFFECDKLVASKEGYCTYSIDVSEISRNSFDIEIILYKVGEEDLVLKYVNHYDDNYQITDLLTRNITYNVRNENDAIKLVFSTLNSDEVAEYQLWQKNKMIASADKGMFQIAAGDFAEGGNCFIRVVGKNGKARDTYIHLSFVSIDIVSGKEVELIKESANTRPSEDVPYFGGLPITVDLPALGIDVKYDDEKVYVGLNLDFPTEDDDVISLNEYFKNIKEDFASIKDTISKKKADEIKKYIEKWDPFELPGGEFDADIVGYAECNIGEKKATGKIYILISAESPMRGFTTWVTVAPITVQFNTEVELKTMLDISYNLETGMLEAGDDGFSFDIYGGLKIFGGLGFGRITGVGIYGNAGTVIGLNILGKRSGVREIGLKGELGIEAYAGPFTYEKVFVEKEWMLYSNPLMSISSKPEQQSISLYAADNYKTESLDYLAQQSQWNGYPIMLDDVEVTTNFIPLLENTYRNAQPVMVANGDTLYAAFLGADEDTEEVYVQCTKMESGVWSEPVRIDSGAILDDAPQLLADNEGNIWLAYAKTGDGYETKDLVSYAKNQNIVVGMLDKNTLTLTNVKEYSSRDYMHMQQLTLVNGVPTVAWVESEITDADSVLASLNNKVVFASYSNGQWSDSSVIKNIDSYVRDMAVGDIGVAYTMDADGDLTTVGDNMFVYCDWTGNENKIIENVNGNITYGVLPGETQSTFIWNDTDKLCSMDSYINVAGITNEYVIKNNSIYYSTPIEGGAELATIRMNNDGTFTGPIQLTETDRYIEDISVETVYGRDVVLGMHTSAEITEDNIDISKNLVWSIVQPVNDIRIDDISYDMDNATPGEKLPVTLTVSNVGENQVDSVNIIYNDEVISTHEIQLKAGESKELIFEIICPDTYTSHMIKVEDSDNDISSDYNSVDNVFRLSVGYANLEVEASLKRNCNEKKVVAMVTNTGIETASGSISFVNDEGNILSLSAITDLECGKSIFVEMPIDAEISDATVNVVVNTKQNELYTHDNTDTVYVPLEDDVYTVTYELDGGIQNSENPANYYESDEEIVLLEPTKEGYKFEGWYSDDEYKTKVKSILSDSTGNITLYAKWSEVIMKNGFHKGDDGQWYYFVDDAVDTSFTGLAKNEYGWWYVKDGELDRTYTGLGKNEYGWWYVKDGKVDLTYTGMAKNEYGWFYVKSGKVDLNYTGLAENQYGTWYMVDGKVASNISGLTKVSKVWLYLTKGKVDTSYTGLAKNDYGWWYVTEGQLDKTYTGMAKNENGWFYVKSGKVDLEYTGLAENQYGTWYMVDGKVTSNISGLTKVSKVWMYLVKGKVDTDYVGLAKNESGWWYVENGTVDFTYTGMAKNQYGWWYVTNGQLDRSFTGIASNEYGSWYIKNGAVEKTYTGTVTFNGVTYNVKNGKVV